MPLMPMPPIPTKWMGPISRGSLMRVYLSLRLLDALLRKALTRAFSSFRGTCEASEPGISRFRVRVFDASRNDGTSDSRDFHHQIGQPLRRIEPPDATR